MDRMLQVSLAALTIASLCGCCHSPEDRLGIKYATPEIPVDLDQYFTPDPNQKAFELLRAGETQIEMHEYYRSCHRAGWRYAVSELSRRETRQFNGLDDVYAGWIAMKTGCEAFWAGYENAYTQYGISHPE